MRWYSGSTRQAETDATGRGKEIEWTRRGNGERERILMALTAVITKCAQVSILEPSLSPIERVSLPFSRVSSFFLLLSRSRDNNYPLESFIAAKVTIPPLPSSALSFWIERYSRLHDNSNSFIKSDIIDFASQITCKIIKNVLLILIILHTCCIVKIINFYTYDFLF